MESPQTRLCPSLPPAAAEPGPDCGQRCPGGEHILDQKGVILDWLPSPRGQEVATGWASSQFAQMSTGSLPVAPAGPTEDPWAKEAALQPTWGWVFPGSGKGATAHLGGRQVKGLKAVTQKERFVVRDWLPAQSPPPPLNTSAGLEMEHGGGLGGQDGVQVHDMRNVG